jgi:MraZ protein
MTQFLGTHMNKLDAKGRVSIPAPFRTALRNGENGQARVVLRPSHNHPCIEGWSEAGFEALGAPLDLLERFSESHEDLSMLLFATAHSLEADKEGRIVLPDALVAHANLSETVVFMGLRDSFQIWEPAAAERRRLAAFERARVRGLTLPGMPR